MASIWTIGEILVEIMRPKPEMPLNQPGEFLGPYPSGAPAIFIDTVARLGHSAGIIGGVGEDDFGRCVLDRLEADGVDCHLVRRYPGEATAVAFVTYFSDGSRKFLYHIDHTPAVLTGFDGSEDLGTPDFFHVMGCSLMANMDFAGHILSAMRACLDRGTRVSFDPNIRTELLRGRSLESVVGPVLEHCSILLPGRSELALLSGESESEAGVQRLFDRYPLELVVLKCGQQGCCIYKRGEAALSIPAYPVTEVDPTGAGDCFDAGFLCGLLEGRTLADCARIASAAGALNAAAFGPMEGAISADAVARLSGLT